VPRGVVLVHGFLCNRAFWTPWLAPLRARGHAFVAVTLEPAFGSIDDYAPAIEAAVRRVTEATGQAPLIVGHSMGGLAIRAWLRHARWRCACTAWSRLVRHTTAPGLPPMRAASPASRCACGPWLQRRRRSRRAQGAVPVLVQQRRQRRLSPAAATLAGADNRFVASLAHAAGL
jgi:pimeloyl-ACP methyl ester carboxylesterase